MISPTAKLALFITACTLFSTEFSATVLAQPDPRLAARNASHLIRRYSEASNSETASVTSLHSANFFHAVSMFTNRKRIRNCEKISYWDQCCRKEKFGTINNTDFHLVDGIKLNILSFLSDSDAYPIGIGLSEKRERSFLTKRLKKREKTKFKKRVRNAGICSMGVGSVVFTGGLASMILIPALACSASGCASAKIYKGVRDRIGDFLETADVSEVLELFEGLIAKYIRRKQNKGFDGAGGNTLFFGTVRTTKEKKKISKWKKENLVRNCNESQILSEIIKVKNYISDKRPKILPDLQYRFPISQYLNIIFRNLDYWNLNVLSIAQENHIIRIHKIKTEVARQEAGIGRVKRMYSIFLHYSVGDKMNCR